ncbi:hypothetical protein DFP90_11457 [Aestuariispira insulae]|uniref:Uncharacterized protein n=2 Tax=Aestuariispira insulae TaxID=1461337 RepID=A0A3D9H5B0_9PROT|nr:hypothetical protein DFP90_11457 [Aestuariispira insulae]
MEGLIALGADTPLSTEEAIAHRQETKTLVSEGLTTFHRKSGGYFSLDKETCRLRRLVSITDHAFWNARLPTIAERAVAGVNGLITYQGKNYIYDFQYAPLTGDKSDNDLTLYELTSEGSSEVCKFYQNEGTQGE